MDGKRHVAHSPLFLPDNHEMYECDHLKLVSSTGQPADYRHMSRLSQDQPSLATPQIHLAYCSPIAMPQNYELNKCKRFLFQSTEILSAVSHNKR